jgi:hypothetical protein
MIDPISAFAAVQSAVALIKKASATVDDVASLGPLIGKYFQAKHTATKAVIEAKKNGGSNMSKAIEIELQIKAQKDFEKQLSDLFFSTNNMDVWNSIKKRASDMDKEDLAAKIQADKERRKQEARNETIMEWTILIVLVIILGCFTTYLLINFFDVCEAKQLC